MPPRRTLNQPVSLSGEGVRSGRSLTVTLAPAEAGAGLRLERTDTGGAWPLDLSAAVALPGCSAIGDPAHHVAYVEHLLAAFSAVGLTDARVTVSGPELPLLDGSARPWLDLLAQAGLRDLPGTVEPLVLAAPLTVQEGEAFVLAWPAEEPALGYLLDHPHPLVGRQRAEYRPGADDFAAVLAPARTFTTIEEAEYARAHGLLRGGSEDNALVIYPDRLSADPGLPQACARHKLLDLVGDLYLLGRPVQARILAYQTGHRHNQSLARALRDAAGEA